MQSSLARALELKSTLRDIKGRNQSPGVALPDLNASLSVRAY